MDDAEQPDTKERLKSFSRGETSIAVGDTAVAAKAIESVSSTIISGHFRLTVVADHLDVRAGKVIQTLLPSHQRYRLALNAGQCLFYCRQLHGLGPRDTNLNFSGQVCDCDWRRVEHRVQQRAVPVCDKTIIMK